MKWRILWLSLLTTACQPAKQNVALEVLARQNDVTLTNPAGRYQIIEGANRASVAVLDTRFGYVQNCILVDSRYHCLAQRSITAREGGLPEAPQGRK